ncbi:hypothetical protein [Micromonospora thermarum]|uniref:Uncharacterized protein n=1 Tax=Micromonospora thermarum TaxID=2720024 RepID=A0ABX0Z4K0_9ACTN|nr:hypothetical protein [Micromonospora thermarum]NJP32244.1 hypothetical protein [Micromonospora thermarum]
MPENYTDPAGNTEAFRVFANTPEPQAPTAAGRAPLLVGAAVAAVVLVVLAAWLALG